MLRLQSIRARLMLATGAAILGLVCLSGFTVYIGRHNTAALESVYEGSVRSLAQLQKVDSELREVRFRAAGVLLDIMPVQGSLNHVREARATLDRVWTEVASSRDPAQDDLATLRREMRAGWPAVQALLGRIEDAYAAKDTKRLSDLVDADWAQAHKAFIKPLQKSIPLEEARARETFEAASRTNSRLGLLSVAIAIAFLAGIGATMALTARHVVTSLRGATQSAQAIAQGDLTREVRATRRDEVGELLAALAAMQHSLAATVGEIRLGAQSMAHASREIATGNTDLSSRTEKAAGNLQQTASSMEEMTGVVRASAANASQANTLAASAAGAAARGGEAMARVVSTMGEIHESSRQIAEIITVIDGIAFQTNILALNAAVEAARAGEQGRGFAVVAGEVRALAQRSAEASRQIRDLIQTSVEKVAQGSRLVADTGTTIEEAVSQVQRVHHLVGEISGATGEQSRGIAEVNQAVTELDRMTQQNAALAEQSAAAAESLQNEADRLTRTVSVFRTVEA